ncbi:hypothetical protein SOPP22_11840 [Shewanella sp. OPT22]|nr:hypothetical protein SOPP22_11840 [Shewanella sp. OPT22]
MASLVKYQYVRPDDFDFTDVMAKRLEKNNIVHVFYLDEKTDVQCFTVSKLQNKLHWVKMEGFWGVIKASEAEQEMYKETMQSMNLSSYEQSDHNALPLKFVVASFLNDKKLMFEAMKKIPPQRAEKIAQAMTKVNPAEIPTSKTVGVMPFNIEKDVGAIDTPETTPLEMETNIDASETLETVTSHLPLSQTDWVRLAEANIENMMAMLNVLPDTERKNLIKELFTELVKSHRISSKAFTTFLTLIMDNELWGEIFNKEDLDETIKIACKNNHKNVLAILKDSPLSNRKETFLYIFKSLVTNLKSPEKCRFHLNVVNVSSLMKSLKPSLKAFIKEDKEFTRFMHELLKTNNGICKELAFALCEHHIYTPVAEMLNMMLKDSPPQMAYKSFSILIQRISKKDLCEFVTACQLSNAVDQLSDENIDYWYSLLERCDENLRMDVICPFINKLVLSGITDEYQLEFLNQMSAAEFLKLGEAPEYMDMIKNARGKHTQVAELIESKVTEAKQTLESK